MRRIVLLLFVLALTPAITEAQSSDKKGWGYLFGGPGGASGGGDVFLHVGGGGEGLVYGGLGVGGELGYFTPFNDLGDGIGLASVNLSGHFNRKAKVSPFITGGFSAAFRNGASGGGNFGGGVHYWVSDNVGMRFEFRDHIFSSDSAHLFSFRVGISFR